MQSRFARWLALLCAFWTILSTHSQVYISEFLASNVKSLLDQDAEFSDWIELYNGGQAPVNMAGWYLTDDVTDLKKWKFPAISIDGGKFLVVFASNKDRKNTGAELHTNFKLSGDGEFLALVKPDGTTIASQFAPKFPVQVPDVSFGFGIDQVSTTLVSTGAVARYFAPSGAVVNPAWTGAEFDDSAWSSGPMPLGFSKGETGVYSDFKSAMASTQPLAWWSFEETAGTNAATAGKLSDLVANYVNGTALNQVSAGPPGQTGFASTNLSPRFDGINDYFTTKSTLLNGLTEFTLSGWIKPAVTNTPRMGFFGQHDVAEVGFSDSGVVQFNTLEGGSLKVLYPYKANEWHHIAAVATGSGLRLFLDGKLATASLENQVRNYGSSAFPFNIGGGGIFDNAGNAFRGLLDEVAIHDHALADDEIYALYQSGASPGAGYTAVTGTEVSDTMFDKSSSLLVRTKFAASADEYDRLSLKIRSDDGFVAYLNGVEIASRNAPTTLDENSAATSGRPGGSGIVVEEIDLSARLGLLHPGTNVLAIHALNLGKSDPDFFISPELVATKTSFNTNALRYFTTPTPSAANGFGNPNIGPLIRDVRHTPEVPKDDEDITVTARIDQTFDPVKSVTLTYRIMYLGETNLVMSDDGLHGDGAAGDGVYGVVVPVSGISTNGQMIRYAITATDSNGDTNRAPAYLDKLNSPQYFGTVVFDPSLTNPLPVLQWFIQTATAADNAAGARASFFYDGVFYDNVFMNLHGQSSQSFPKHSYNINFNWGYHFRYSSNEVPVKGFNLLSTYPDKAHVRNILSYDTYRDAGSAYHLVFPIRVQQNAKFWGDAHWCEDGDADFLNRLGLDPRGSLYKMYGTFSSGTAEFEKKTRRTESSQDLQDFFTGTGLTGTSLRNYLWDNADIPATINFLAAMAITGGVDCCHKNYYFYHDLEGTGEWRGMPWDVDLTWGRDWNSADTYFDDRMHPLDGIGVGNNNRFFGILMNAQQQPVWRAMYVRRIRTLMDQQLQPPGTPTNALKYEKRMDDIYAINAPDAALDFAKWTTWGTKQTMLQAINILKTNYFPQRRTFLYSTTQNREIPAAQPTNVVINIAKVEYNPVSGNQDEEYVMLRNTNTIPVDISDWKLTGAIQHTFRPGTVLATNVSIYVSPNVRAFRGRRVSPKGGESLFVQGNYQGQLSAWGEAINLVNDKGVQVDQFSYTATPSSAQESLRITGIMYNPPSMAGQTNNSDYEYLRLQNIGQTAVDLNGVHFSRGIDFTFTGSAVTNLNAAQEVYVVKNASGFAARYGTSVLVAGEYLGSLDSSGETLRLDDAAGEKILEFAYNNAWYPSTDGQGDELAVKDKTVIWSNWGEKTNWFAASVTLTNSDTLTLEQWKAKYFTAAELLNAALSSDAADPDGDGVSNVQEFIAGTDPRDKTSNLRVELTTKAFGAYVIRFSASAGKSYSILYRDDVASGTWKSLGNTEAGAAREVLLNDIAPVGLRRFYRLVTPKTP